MATITAAAGGGNWTTGTTWVGGVAPTSADDAVLDATSGAVTINSGAVCRSLNCTGYTGTLTHTPAVTLTIGDATAGAGNVALLLVSGMTYALGNLTTSAISFVSTSSTTQTIATGGKLLGNQTINGAGSSYQLTSSHGMAAIGCIMTLTAGTLDTNGQTCTWGGFASSNSNVRTLTLGASSINVTGVGTSWNITTSTNLTLNAGTSTITASGATITFAGGGKTYNNVIFSGSGNTTLDNTGATFANLTRTGTAARGDALTFNAAHTITGTLTLAGNSILNRLLVTSSVIGTARTLTAASLTASHVDFRDITGAGAASWDVSAITGGSGNCGGNSGITFTAPLTLYWFQNTGTWSDSTKWFLGSGGSGGTGRVPLPQDDVIFDANSFNTASQTVTTDMPRMSKNQTWTGATNSPTLAQSAFSTTIYGSWVLISAMSLTGTQGFVFESRSAATLTTAGKTFPAGLSFQSTGGYTLQDNLTVTGAINLNNGTLIATTQNVQSATFNGNNNNTKTLTMGSGTWTVTGTGDVWRLAPGATTLNAGTSTLVFSDTSASSKTLNGSTSFVIAPYYRISIPGGGTGAVIFGGNITFNTIDITAPKSITFASSNTFNVTNFNMIGSPGNLITVTATTSGTAAILSKTTGTVVCDYLSLKDSNAIGGATWYAGANSINVSGNSGWLFTSPSAMGGSTQQMMGV